MPIVPVEQQRIAEDLAGVFHGELLLDSLSRVMYSTDASLYQVVPLAVACPRRTEDLVALAKYATERSIPLIPRGAGTGLAGGAVGTGIVVDCARNMHAIEAVSEDTVRVQAGVVRDKLNQTLRSFGRYFPPDPSNSAVTTVGGMLAVDAAGSHAIRVGSTRDHVRSIEVVLADGTCFEAGSEPLNRALLDSDSSETKRNLVDRISRLLRDNSALIRERQPANQLRNVAGYHLRTVLGTSELHLPRLLVGSEGTLGIFTAATLHTAPLPANRGAVLLLFGDLEGAIRAVRGVSDQQPSACDLLDRRLLTLAREADERFEQIISRNAEAALLIEQTGFNPRQVADRLRSVIEVVRRADPSVRVGFEATAPDDVEFLWSLPQRVVPLLLKMRGNTRPLPFVEDLAVPPEALQEITIKAQKVFQKHQVTASLYAHAASGQLHFRPFLSAPTDADGPKLEALARDLYEAVFSVGGAVSGEHGDGRSRTAFLRSQYGPLYRVLRQIKEMFDPQNLLNPGKIISDDPHLTIRNLRAVPTAPRVLSTVSATDSVNGEVRPAKEPGTFVELQLLWGEGELGEAASRCNGCGQCRTQSPLVRMCPFFKIEPTEEASPRSKANVVRGLVAGLLDSRLVGEDDMHRLTSLCFNCKQCELECPAEVNIPQLMIEAKAGYVAANGLNRADWILSRAHSFGGVGSAIAPLANWALRNSAARWFMEKFLGISRHRTLPPFARRSFLRQVQHSLSRRELLPRDQKRVVYFVDHFANYHDPELAHALVAIMKHHGYAVYVPGGQTASGLAMISAGDLDAARELAETNIRELAELAREGLPIVCTEPAAALCLQVEYPRLLKHPDVALVASAAIDAGEFLRRLSQTGELRTDFQPFPATAGYHTPCHVKALTHYAANRDELSQTAEPPFLPLLRLIPEFVLKRLEHGCSGMAGAFGLTKQNFQTSVRMGWGLITRLQAGDLTIGLTECSSCRMQMEQGTKLATWHPLKVLAQAYGLTPPRKSRNRM